MLNNSNSFTFEADLLDAKGLVTYAHLRDLGTSAGSIERVDYAEDLDYIFQLICHSFTYIDAREGCLPLNKIDGKEIFYLSLIVLSLPFKNETNPAEVEQWNDLVKQVSSDFLGRKNDALRGCCTYEDLEALVRDNLENFDYPDRKRLDANKLINLIVFVYDYCILSLRESRLHPHLDHYVNGDIVIRDKSYPTPLRICAAVSQYEPFEMVQMDGFQRPFENYELPRVRPKDEVQNPHVSDSVLSAMFSDLLHKFFLSFGLQRKGNSQWAKPERMLIYELLRVFGLCKSSKPAAESKYVTTVLSDYGDYFSTCNLRTWIRDDQAYSYLICCPVEAFISKGQQIKEPFISLEDYEIVEDESNKEEKETTKEQKNKEKRENKPVDLEQLPADMRKSYPEIAGRAVIVTNTEHDYVCFASVVKNASSQEKMDFDPRLDYVIDLIHSSFDYISFAPFLQKYILVRNDLQNPQIQSNLIASLNKELLDRLDSIPRGIFDPEKLRHIIEEFHSFLPREDRARFNVEKFYILSLFVFDYVYLTYKESTVTPHLRKFIPSKIRICGDSIESTILTDDMLLTYIHNPYSIERTGDSTYCHMLREPSLYVPETNFPIEHPSCTVKNMTAMFFDLFARFFRTMELTKRSDVKYTSEQESNLIGEMANCCGICVTDKMATARTMFMSNKDYFQKSSLFLSIRENEYGYLMMNNMSDELFGPEWPTEQ